MFVVQEHGQRFDYLLRNLFEIYEVCHATECAWEVFDWELSKIIYQDN